ncbi:GGDEF domain-containing protein [Micromonospora sp. NPDC047707]|uniref:GGDEF domain-containing protein n=1 Tax=Micromonospora sp. NPDC047707 TaxID=3154498 RepID=UPI003453A602
MNERRRRMRLSAALHVVSHGVAVLYCLLTLDQPHRGKMLVMYGCGMAGGAVGLWAARRVTTKAAGYRTSGVIMMVTLVALALGSHWDGGAAAPAALGFVTTVVFVATQTPGLRLMIALEVLTLGTYVGVAAVGEPMRPGHLFINVAGMIVLISVCSTQARKVARQRSQLRALATLDPLTGALNRRGLAEFASTLFVPRCRPGPSLLCLDLDDFKLVNDRYGHAAGDQLLQTTVAAVRRTVRPDDVVARIGGDEFVVVLVEADAATAQAVTARVDAAVGQQAGVSIGWATAPYDGTTLESLMHAADQRLYRVKQEKHRATGTHLPSRQPDTLGVLP